MKELSGNARKKEKLELLSKADEENLSKMPENDRSKAGEMKQAMNLLSAKRVEIGEYLEYLDIIEEEDEDKNSNDYDNLRLPRKAKGLTASDKKQIGMSKGKGSSKKVQKRDRTARKEADDLVISYDGHGLYDD